MYFGVTLKGTLDFSSFLMNPNTKLDRNWLRRSNLSGHSVKFRLKLYFLNWAMSRQCVSMMTVESRRSKSFFLHSVPSSVSIISVAFTCWSGYFGLLANAQRSYGDRILQWIPQTSKGILSASTWFCSLEDPIVVAAHGE